MSSKAVTRTLILLTVICAGFSMGIGLYTFHYAEGTSYFSKDPEACVNCHIMRPQFDSWQKSSHKAVASCVDCHLPHDFVGKYIAKAENGWNHSKAFTLQNFPEPIQITPKNSQILQDNCVDCHAELTHAQRSVAAFAATEQQMKGQFQCVHCHADVGHGIRVGLGVLETHPGRAGLKRLREEIGVTND